MCFVSQCALSKNALARFKLGDLGMAKEMRQNGPHSLAGTAGFLAPEVIRGGGYGLSCDLYSLAMMMHCVVNLEQVQVTAYDDQMKVPPPKKHLAHRPKTLTYLKITLKYPKIALESL